MRLVDATLVPSTLVPAGQISHPLNSFAGSPAFRWPFLTTGRAVVPSPSKGPGGEDSLSAPQPTSSTEFSLFINSQFFIANPSILHLFSPNFIVSSFTTPQPAGKWSPPGPLPPPLKKRHESLIWMPNWMKSSQVSHHPNTKRPSLHPSGPSSLLPPNQQFNQWFNQWFNQQFSKLPLPLLAVPTDILRGPDPLPPGLLPRFKPLRPGPRLLP
jgi:hypothetical protein